MIKILDSIISLVLVYGPWVVYMFLVPRLVHMFQLEGYNYRDYIRWLGKNLKKTFMPGIKQLVACGITYAIITVFNIVFLRNVKEIELLIIAEYYLMFIIFYVFNILQILKDKQDRKVAKKKLVYTARAKRLMFWNFALMVLLQVSFATDGYELVLGTGMYLYFSVFIALIPFNVVIANFLAWPTESWINDKYINKARRKLNKKEYKNLIKIGITGSYGKTSTKFILKTILSEKYNVLATPESYNTTMGNVRVIREQLKPEHEVFISEMGARYKRDIYNICEFVKPQYAMITSIGPQHLESFKSIDNVVKTKSEIITSLDTEGVVFLPRDNEHCLKLFNKETREKYSYSMKDSKADVYAKDVTLNENGSNFVAVTSLGKINCTTKLLGEHNIENILGCISIAIKLGLTKEQIENGVKKIEPIPHRLQILNNNNGTIVIDDAFNSNPVGSKKAIDVLGSFSGRKIVITPGMVELGFKEIEENRKFGKHMAKTIDIAILVGIKRSEPIVEGLRQGGFNDNNIFVVRDLKEATAKLAEISKQGDVILFENDLPDNYNE